MTPMSFKAAVRKLVKTTYDVQSIEVLWANDDPSEEEPPEKPEAHVECYFRAVDGGDVAFGGQARKERYTYLLFLAARAPLGSREDAAENLAWTGLRAVSARSAPGMVGVRVNAERRLREDGEIRGMYQVTAIVELSFDYNENV